MQDPEEEGEIPHCTLKMFPEEALHCIEWARDKFGKNFSLRPKAAVKIYEDKGFQADGDQDVRQLRECVKIVKNRP